MPRQNPHLTSEVVRVVWTKFRAFLDGGAGCPGGGPKAAIHSGLDSALGSHPCVALSSYQASGKQNYEKIAVQLRIISLQDSPVDFGESVTKTNNRQNKIENRDFVAL